MSMPLIIKVASIPKERMQVYFIDNEDYFKRKATYADENGKLFSDNDERAIFFAKGVIETVKKLNWSPDIIHVHGWLASFLPLYLKKYYDNEPLFENSKVITSVYSQGFEGSLNSKLIDKIKFDGIDEEAISDLKDPNYLNIMKVAVYHNDNIEFLCLILTLWHMGKIPVIPVNTLDSTLRSVEMETDCFIGEFSGRDHPPPCDLAKQVTNIDKSKDNHQPVALIMFTSGSSGAPKAVYKTFNQINAEIRILEEHWGADLKNTITTGTVSHNHMYGLPFLLLWTLNT